MLKLKEINCLENRVEIIGNTPIHIYISLVEKYRNGCKIDGASIILAHDAGFPGNRKYSTMVGGNINTLKSLIQNGHIPFDPLDYDGTDFPNSYLSKLIPLVKIKEKHKFPKDFLNWEYDVDSFDYVKSYTIDSPLKKKTTQRIVYDIAPKRIHLPLTICKITPKVSLPAPKPIVEIDRTPPKPSDMSKYVVYD